MLLYILIAILLFGVLIFVHELGHFLTARLFHVKIYEFSIGMGPKLISKKSKKTDTAYSLRLLPIGGFVSMAGEDEESDDENSLRRKPVWQRIIITAAGSVFNLLLGFLVMLFIVISMKSLGSTTIYSFQDNASSQASGLMVGDTIVSVDGHRAHIASDMNYYILRYGTKPIDITVIRNGEKIVIEDVVFPTQMEQDILFGKYDFSVLADTKNFGTVIKNTFYQSVMTVRMVYDSLYDLITGKYGLQQLSGPVGITGVVTDYAQDAVEGKDSSPLFYLFVVLAINLGCMNLLPFPALDGGRIVFLIVEGIRRKPINPKVEGYIHAAGMVLLLLLMLVVTCKDIFTLIKPGS